jgi:GMP synthase-like glutamine amidotransferase
MIPRAFRHRKAGGQGPRLEGPRRAGSGQGCDLRAKLPLERDPLGLARGLYRTQGARLQGVAHDYGAKRNILRCLASVGCDVTVLPATATAEDVLALNPEGVFLSNGPGDPAATGAYAVPMIQGVSGSADLPLFGICLGHQMLALALGAKTIKMNHGHHGANHPVKDLTTGKVEITSMNHGFTVDSQTLPKGVRKPMSRCSTARIAASRWMASRSFGAVSPRGQPRPAGQLLSVRTLRRRHAGPPRRLTHLNLPLTPLSQSDPGCRRGHGRRHRFARPGDSPAAFAG